MQPLVCPLVYLCAYRIALRTFIYAHQAYKGTAFCALMQITTFFSLDPGTVFLFIFFSLYAVIIP